MIYSLRDSLPAGGRLLYRRTRRWRAVFSSSSGDLEVLTASQPATSAIHARAQSAAAGVFSVFFPSPCRICGEQLINISRLPVCESCLESMRPIDAVQCAICGEGLAGFGAAQEIEQRLCGLCQRARPPYVRAVAYGSYEGALRELLHLLKYENVKPAAAKLGSFLAMAVSALELDKVEVIVVPVPLDGERQRERSFNQAELIARAACNELGKNFRLETCALRRKRHTASQTGLTRHQRRANLRAAFEASSERLAESEVLLVDDVFTTGTTASECSRVLLRARAKRVFVATVARVFKMGSL
jgi:ComF family protein